MPTKHKSKRPVTAPGVEPKRGRKPRALKRASITRPLWSRELWVDLHGTSNAALGLFHNIKAISAFLDHVEEVVPPGIERDRIILEFGCAPESGSVRCETLADRSRAISARSIRSLIRALKSKDGTVLRELANLVEGKSGDPLMIAMREIILGLGVHPGENLFDIASKVPIDQIMDALTKRGVHADRTTVRKALNAIGVQRRPGRPRK